MPLGLTKGDHFSNLSFSLKILFTATLITLGLGYCFAMIQVYETHAGLDGKSGINANDIAIAYSGNANSNRLQVALLGAMSANAPSKERRAIMDWAADGADKTQYEETIKPLVDNRCIRCHDGKTVGAPSFLTFEDFAEFAKPDTGMSLATLVRVSHIHLFGMTFIFFIMGLIFSHARMRPAWAQPVIIAIPFLMMITDIGSWYLTKLNTSFTWIIILSGALMGLCFAIEWCVSMYQIWFNKALPDDTRH
ncbi:MAG: elongation factor-1 alpha [bacterium]